MPWINWKHLLFCSCCCFCLLLALLQVASYSVNCFSITFIIYWLSNGSNLVLERKLQSPSWSHWQWDGCHFLCSLLIKLTDQCHHAMTWATSYTRSCCVVCKFTHKGNCSRYVFPMVFSWSLYSSIIIII